MSKEMDDELASAMVRPGLHHGQEAFWLARASAPPGRRGQHGARQGRIPGDLWAMFASCLLIGLATSALSCDSTPQPPAAHKTLAYHGKVALGVPMSGIVEACGGSVCALETPDFAEIEYISDTSANVKGYLLRTKAPDPPNVQQSQEIFEATRKAVMVKLGPGESFLKSGDPTYWPARGKAERVVTLTSDDQGHTVLAVGAVGPDSEKIPDGGAAHDKKQVAAFWKKITAAAP